MIKSLDAMSIKNDAGKNMVDPKQGFKVIFNDFGDSSVDLFVTCWVLVEEKAGVVARIKEVIYNTLNKNNIEIPFPQRDVYIRQMPKYEETGNSGQVSGVSD
jgi:small-conductance mechanosensitive channel